MNRINYLFLIILIPILAFATHKYYISLTRIDFIEEEKAIQITMRFFIDDIEHTIENRFTIKLELATKDENKKSDLYLEKYILQKVKIKINDEIEKLNYLGKEYENDLVFFYLEILDINHIDRFEIQNSMLLEEFTGQHNYIKMNINKIKKTSVLFRENDKEMLNF